MTALFALVTFLAAASPPLASGADEGPLHLAQIQGQQPATWERHQRMQEMRRYQQQRLEEESAEPEPERGMRLHSSDAGPWDGWYEPGAFHRYPYGDGDPYALEHQEDPDDVEIKRRDWRRFLPF